MNNPAINTPQDPYVAHYQIIVVGGGSAGIAVTASLLKRQPDLRILILEPSDVHYYQPGWTMVGGGVFAAESTRKTTAELIPQGAHWIQQRVIAIHPERKGVQLDNNQEVSYDQLILCPGLVLNWAGIDGLEATLGQNGVTSNYRYDLAPYTWQCVQSLRQGRAVFTQPPMPIKCAGAPQKALYLSADHWYRNGLLDKIQIDFFTAANALFGVKEYVPALEQYIKKYRAQVHFQQQLVKVDGAAQLAWFESTDAAGNTHQTEVKFAMLHVCPPQQAPDFIRTSSLADAKGWLAVDPATLRHQQYANIWGLGDVINTTNAKTMAAVRKQVPVLADNLVAVLAAKEPTAAYDGYGSCPLTVERGKIVLAEFVYGGKLSPTFPQWLNQGTKPTRFAWLLKERFLPPFYWHGMLKAREWLVAPNKTITNE